MIKSLTAIIALALAGPCLAQTTWQMPTPYPEASVVTRNVMRFADEVREATGGKLNIVIHPAGSLIKHGEIKNAVRSGQVEIGEILASTLSNDDPIYEMDSLPFLVNDFEDAQRLWGVVREHAQKDMTRQRMTLLFANSWGPQGLYSKSPIQSTEDMRGAKFRAYNYSTERIAQLAGAVPTQVEAADMAQAFSTGRVNMMVTSTATGVSAAVWDFLDHYYDVRVSIPFDLILVNNRALEALEPDVRSALAEVAARSEGRSWSMAEDDDKEKLKTLSEKGITVEPGSDALRNELKKIGETMSAEWEKRAGPTGSSLLKVYKDQ
ncbi:TRAP transporter substrate-binding protein [Allopusillimonas ginsengisoli]|uniref:TRAP transporter substrate-binding protein n=1 Tax=Allopusillimonas ginsengisoli TaxID=453575 RepID=UPI0039C2AB71